MKVYNLGSLNIDYVYSVDHFVAAKETLSSSKMDTFPGGKGLNQSVALAKAGCEVVHGALVGDGAEFLVRVLEDAGVDCSKLERRASAPGHAIIQVAPNGENCIMLFSGTNRALDRDYVERFLADAKEGDVLLAQNETNCIYDAFEIAKERGMKIAFNPSPCDDGILSLPLEYVDYWFCNEVEADRLFGFSDPEAVCRAFQNGPFDAALILTLGEAGSYFCDKDVVYRQKAYKKKAVDTTAAGDTFTGYFLASVSRGLGYGAAMDVASRASAVTVTRLGASSSIPSIDEL